MYKYGDKVEFKAFGHVWTPGTVYAVFPNRIVIYVSGYLGGTDLVEVEPDHVRPA